MATSKEYKEFILEQLDLLDNITCKAMMGEFLLYYNEERRKVLKIVEKILKNFKILYIIA